MATRTPRRRWFARQPVRPSRAFPAARTHPQLPGRRALTAAATTLDLNDRKQIRRERVLREGWQNEAWAYRDQVPEVRFAVNFLANCARRMQMFPAAYQVGGSTDNPVPLAEVKDIPKDVLEATTAAFTAIGNGRLAWAGLMHSLSTNVSITGEAFLLGQEDPATGDEVWTIRSTSEIIIKDDRYTLREVPADSQGAVGWIDLDPDTTVLSRMWVPHPQWQLLADSPMRTMLETCEAIQILRRGIRASGRSRLAGAGVLAIPEELELKRPDDDNEDPQSDDVVGAIADAAMTAIADEGVASAVVPIILQGPGAFLDKIKLIAFHTGYDAEALAALEYLVGVFATGFDLPKMVITGAVEEANHWTAWAVGADTFRHYAEPHVVTCADLITSGYLRPALIAAGVPLPWVNRILTWYDPVDLIKPPDRAVAAAAAHTAFAISDKSYRDAIGFSDDDRPSAEELQTRMFQHIRTFPPNLMMEWARENNPALIVPPITVAGTIPGIKPGGVDVGQPQLPGAPPALPAAAADPAKPGLPAIEQVPEAGKPVPDKTAVTAAGALMPSAKALRLSRKLTAIDADLRARLRVAANTAMVTQLQRAGARVKNAAHGRSAGVSGKTDEAIIRMAKHPDVLVAAAVGERLVTQMGLSADQLLGKEWLGLKAQFYEWTEAAQHQAIVNASRIAGISDDADAAAVASTAMAAGRDAAWGVLAAGLTGLSHQLLYNPDPNTDRLDLTGVNINALVPTGLIRTTLAVAGGAPVDAAGMPLTSGAGQIGTGGTISDMLQAGGATLHNYEWSHGPSLDPLEAHLDLDGVEFESFDDDSLANKGDFPDNAYYLPGDHDGCLCDVTPLWMTAGDGEGDTP